MNWLKAAWAWVRSLPVARYLKPLWKGALKLALQEGGDVLQEEVRAAVAKGGPPAADAAIDAAQRRMQVALEKLPLPSVAALMARDAVQKYGDELQERLRPALSSGVPAMVDQAFDSAQVGLLRRIDAL